MKVSALLSALVLCPLLATSSTHAQNTTASILASTAATFSGSKPVHSVTLAATAQWVAGSDNESGNATLTASADGSFNVQFELSQSARTEAQTSFASGQSCTWSGTDGVAQSVAGQNCMSSLNWFLPLVSLFGGQQLSNVNTALVNSGSSPQFLDMEQTQTPSSGLDPNTSALLTHLSTVDLYVDPTTYLPSIFAYNVHPDSNAATDIPVQVVFANYQNVSGVTLPFRITRYVNGVLNLDLTVTQASSN